MPPVRITSNIPMLAMPTEAFCRSTLPRLRDVRKESEKKLAPMISSRQIDAVL